MPFGKINYNLHDNEIILLETYLIQKYFDQLIPTQINEHVQYTSHDTTQPIQTQEYSSNMNENVVKKDEYVEESKETENVKEIKSVEQIENEFQDAVPIEELQNRAKEHTANDISRTNGKNFFQRCS